MPDFKKIFRIGISDFSHLLIEKFISNLNLAQSKGAELFEYLSKINIKVLDLFLKPSTITDFSVLCIVCQDDFISEKITDAYSKTIEEKKKSRNATFRIDFSFMPDNGHVNTKKIASDGYILKYGKK